VAGKHEEKPAILKLATRIKTIKIGGRGKNSALGRKNEWNLRNDQGGTKSSNLQKKLLKKERKDLHERR